MEDQQPLDPRPKATEITELAELATSDVTLTFPKLLIGDVFSLELSEDVVIDSMLYDKGKMAGAFCLGDRILKVNDTAIKDRMHFKLCMMDLRVSPLPPIDGSVASNAEKLAHLKQELSPCTIVVNRRSFVTSPDKKRMRDAFAATRFPCLRGFSYQVVNCKKQPWDRFLTTSFGFVAENVFVLRKPDPDIHVYIIAEITPNTAAEKYFSVGDCLLDFRGTPMVPGEDLGQFNLTFQQGIEMDVLIARPVSKKARTDMEELIQHHLMYHDRPPMNEDAVNIGTSAAYYHHMLWSKLDSVSILTKPQSVVAAAPAAETPKMRKTSETMRPLTLKKEQEATPKGPATPVSTELATAVERSTADGKDSGKHIEFDEKRSFQEISTDVPEGKELQSVGYRHPSNGEGDDGNKEDKKDKDDSERKEAKPEDKPVDQAREAPRRAVVGPYRVPYVIKKTKETKRGLFSPAVDQPKK